MLGGALVARDDQRRCGAGDPHRGRGDHAHDCKSGVPMIALPGHSVMITLALSADNLISEVSRHLLVSVGGCTPRVQASCGVTQTPFRRRLHHSGAEFETRAEAAAPGCASVLALAAYMRKMPNCVSGIGAFSAAEMPSASTRRVSSGSMMPSSQSRAVE